MKIKLKSAGFLLSALGFILVISGCAKEADMNQVILIDDLVTADLEEITLTEAEVEMLKFMREEEKLAHDVYLELAVQYPKVHAFEMITNSESNHVDKVKYLLDHFGIEDPASDVPGEFVNVLFDSLYTALLDAGLESVKKALIVGATIEDLDIYDLEFFMEDANDALILKIFAYLECGSRNHLRSFISLLDKRGETYTPLYISEELFNAILAEPHENCSLAI